MIVAIFFHYKFCATVFGSVYEKFVYFPIVLYSIAKKLSRIFKMKKLHLFIIFSILIVSSCKSKGSLTPREAFIELKHGYLSKNSKAVLQVLSKKSIIKIKRMCKGFHTMRPEQIRSLAQNYRINASVLKKINPEQYLHFFFFSDLNKLVDKRSLHIVSIKGTKSKAKIILKNSLKLDFIKEGPYWKLDITDF